MDWLTILLGLLIVFLMFLHRHFTKRRGYLETLGIPVIPPGFWMGSPPHDFHKQTRHEVVFEMHKKHGMTFGRYDGVFPTISTIDPELVKAILVKNFDSFTDVLNVEVKERHTTLDISRGETWRELRKLLSPTFSSGKLKNMLSPMDSLSDRMISVLEERRRKNDGVVNVSEMLQCFALEVISKCAFGIETDLYKNPDQNELVKQGREAFVGFRIKDWTETILNHLFFMFPGLEKLIPIFPPAYDKLYDITTDIMKDRETNGLGDEFISRLIEIKNSLAKDSNLTKDMITSQGIVFFIAGYETTSNTMCTFLHNMARYPEVQEKIYEEVQSVLDNKDGKFDYETIVELTFLEAAILENLRLNGPVTLHTRYCAKDCELRPGFTVKKGTNIEMPIWPSHHNPEFFPDPEEFRPERFLKENSKELTPLTFRAFGGGPRVCIGQRFAMIEMKFALAKILSKYRVVPVSEPLKDLDYNKGEIFMITYPPLDIKFEIRD